MIRNTPIIMTLFLVVFAGCIPNSSTTNKSKTSSKSTKTTTTNPTTPTTPVVTVPTAPTVNPNVVWTPATPAPGKTTVVSSDGVIGANSVVTFGQVFQAGEITTGVTSTYGSIDLPTQMEVKRRHPDGSVRHAILSVKLPQSTTPISFTLGSGYSATGTGVTLAQAQTGPVDYRVDIIETGATGEIGKTFSASLKQGLVAEAKPWITGPLTTEWRTRVVPKSGATAHPSLRVLFDARYQDLSNGRVSIAIENIQSGSTRGDREYNLRVYDTANAVVYSIDGLKHYAQTRHRKILYFGTNSKELMAIVDTERLKISRAIPNYANITIPEGNLAAFYSGWRGGAIGLYQSGQISAYFPMTGGREDIGPLPAWTARAMISRDPRMYQIMLDQAERGAYFNVHYNGFGASGSPDELLSLIDHPTVSFIDDRYNNEADRLPAHPIPSTNPDGWAVDTSHQPSLEFIPYIVTGDHFYLDELYHWTNFIFLNQNHDYRMDGNGLVLGDQTRGQGWSLRTLGHASWIAPDDHWQKNYFTERLTYNFNYSRLNILSANAIGAWGTRGGFMEYSPGEIPWSDPNANPRIDAQISPWQHHFVAYTLFELAERGYPIADLRDYALGFSTKLFTSGSDFDRMWGTAYRLPVHLSNNTYITTMAQLRDVTFQKTKPATPTSLESAGDPNGYAAIALAVMAASNDVGISKANEGYVFIRDEIMKKSDSDIRNHVTSPVWNIIPRKPLVGLTEAPGIYPK